MIFLLLCIIPLLASCASISQKFTPKQKANIGIFADQTINMLSEADFGFSRDSSIYLREFFDYESTEVKEFSKHLTEAEKTFRGIINYSLILVTIAETEKTEKDRVDAYAEYLSGFNEKILKKLQLKPDYYTQILIDISTQENFLGALQTAQPVINAAGRYMHQILDNIQEAVDILAVKLDSEIDKEYERVIHYQEILEDEKYNILESFGYLYGAYSGDKKAFDLLIASGNIRRKALIPKSSPTDEELWAISEHLKIRLDALHKIEMEIKPDWDFYRAAHRELDEGHANMSKQINQARMITLVWLRAHQKMSSGISSPAEWFNIKTLPQQAIKMGAGAVL